MNLDELQIEVEKLLSLLKDRQGTFMWSQFLADRLKNIKHMAEKAGIR